jgi:indole-3-glycerol phosphate synthase
MSSILQNIVKNKRLEVEAAAARVDCAVLRRLAELIDRPCLSMTASIRQTPTAIIAEHKRRSPSRGEILRDKSVAEVVKAYESDGAAACSILTDTQFFGGALTDLDVARREVAIPLLRKDFIVSPYQIYEARVHGADAILLIGSVLTRDEVRRLTDIAHSLSLQVLYEIHDDDDVTRIPNDVDMVGVNNRCLADFSTDISHAVNMIDRLPDDVIRVAESGIASAADVRRLADAGFDAFLVGTVLASGETTIPCLTKQ